MVAFHKHPRIVGNDYTKGSYFVTICTFQQRQLFGQIGDGVGGIREMALNEAGQIVQECWREIPKHFPHVQLHEMQIMPDHLHGILILKRRDPDRSTQWVDGTKGTHAFVPIQDPPKAKGPAPGSLGAIIGAFKSETAKRIARLLGTPGQRIWLHGYHEHQIRTTMGEFGRIARYIAENPQRWKK